MVALIIGHTKDKPGACNEMYDICEYKFNKQLVEDVARDLMVPYKIYIRTTLEALPGQVNKDRPTFAIEFHCNALNKKATGSETLYTNDKSKKLAESILDATSDVLGITNRGIKLINADDRGGYLLSHLTMPCIITEPFFIDNNSDYEVISERYEELVQALVFAIESYYDSTLEHD